MRVLCLVLEGGTLSLDDHSLCRGRHNAHLWQLLTERSLWLHWFNWKQIGTFLLQTSSCLLLVLKRHSVELCQEGLVSILDSELTQKFDSIFLGDCRRHLHIQWRILSECALEQGNWLCIWIECVCAVLLLFSGIGQIWRIVLNDSQITTHLSADFILEHSRLWAYHTCLLSFATEFLEQCRVWLDTAADLALMNLAFTQRKHYLLMLGKRARCCLAGRLYEFDWLIC